MSLTQTALVIPARLAAFKIAQIPVYTAGPGQLLIKYPAVLGLDRAGEIVGIGEGVQGFKKGDRVITPSHFIENKYQGFQQYAIADAALTGKIPSNISYDQAATIPIGLSTAFSGFFAEFPHGAGFPAPLTQEGGRAGAGKTVLILGGASSVGQFAIQVAKIAGFSTIITTASLKNEALLTSQGATHVLDRSLNAESLVTAVYSITSNKPVAAVYDSIGLPLTEELGVAVLAHWHSQTGEKGTFVTTEPQITDFLKNHPSIKPPNIFGVPEVPWNGELLSALYRDKLSGWLENGDIKPNQLEVLQGGLAAIPAGLERLKNNQVSGHKLIVHPHDTA